jgi:S-adenosylmethionine decarboxylase
MTSCGKHIILDAYGINPELLDNVQYLKQLGRFAIAKAGATYIDMVFKKFEPVGCTLLFLLAESHLTFHCAPEFQFLSCDMYCCGEANAEVAIDYIVNELQPDPNRTYRQTIIRGVE